MRIIITGALCALAAGCTTVQARTGASATFPASDRVSSFRLATDAALAAGFTLTSSDSASGLIVATRGSNRILTWENPTINIRVAWADGLASLAMSSTVGGQIIDYGTTAGTMRDLCAALTSLQPATVCNIDPA